MQLSFRNGKLVIGPYELHNQIGEGAETTVFRAVNLDNNKTVALYAISDIACVKKRMRAQLIVNNVPGVVKLLRTMIIDQSMIKPKMKIPAQYQVIFKAKVLLEYELAEGSAIDKELQFASQQ